MFSSLNTLFLNRPSGRGKPAARPRSLRPDFERLEDRATPTVTAIGPSTDFHVDITAGETVSFGRTDNFKFRVTADGVDLPVQQAASSIEKLTIDATNNAANRLDLAGIDLTDFVSLNTVLVKIDSRDTVNRGPGWNAAGTDMIGGQRFLVFTQGNATLKITDLGQAPPPPPTALPRDIRAELVSQQGRPLMIRVSFADTGKPKLEFKSP